MIAPLLWRLFYAKWRSRPTSAEDGYTLLLMFPGDLPVFLDISLDVIAAQDKTHLKEVLVTPDSVPPGLVEHIEKSQRRFADVPLRYAPPKPWELWVLDRFKNPGHNHWLQLVTGIEASTTTHALMHDADLFILDEDFLKQHYETCVERKLDAIGLSEAWDPWYKEHGYSHVTATWELLFSTEWSRQFPPHMLHAHVARIDGEKHMFDTFYHCMCKTAPEKVGRHKRDWRFVHFNYVISTYRWFQKRSGPFEDEHFRLLLVRLLIDACDKSGWSYEVPGVTELAKGLEDATAPVTYQGPETAGHYPEFRNKLETLLSADLLSQEQRTGMRESIALFDQAYSWTP